MPVSLTVADVIDKNRIASENTWLILIDVAITDEFGAVVDTLEIVQNNENVEYDGKLYIATEFSMDFDRQTNEEPSMKLSGTDVTGAIREKMEDYNGGVGSTVTLTVVNSGNMDAEPEMVETFEIMSASAPDIKVEWQLGAENPLKFQYPYRQQYRDRCGWLYKGRRCKYAGAMQTCSFTKEGPNGCRAHANMKNFGGFPSLISPG
jgi:phage-related protein